MPNLDEIGWFKTRASVISAALLPLAGLFEMASRLRGVGVKPFESAKPLLCIANATLGGGGKTPLVADLAAAAAERGLEPQVISHGYGSSVAGGTPVSHRHTAAEVGDEALELAAANFTVWSGKPRVDGVRRADAIGNSRLLIMDDGLFDPAMAKNFVILAVDGDYGFGNRRVVPAGPLRRSLSALEGKVGAVVVLGGDGSGRFMENVPHLGNVPHFYVKKAFHPQAVKRLKPLPTVAFAGISRPRQFFAMAAEVVRLEKTWAFASHASPPPEMLKRLLAADRQLITTTKDYARLPLAAKKRVVALPLTLRWSDETARRRLLDMALEGGC